MDTNKFNYQELIEKIKLLEEENRKLVSKLVSLKDKAHENEKFRAFFHDHPANFLLIDPSDGRILDANRTASDFYGYTLSQMKSMNISQLNTLSPSQIHEELQAVKNKTKNHYYFKHRLANGEIRDIEAFVSPIEWEGTIVIVSLNVDITERKQAEETLGKNDFELKEQNREYEKLTNELIQMNEQLLKAKDKAEEADKLKSAFLSNMSHEIRTPMNAIKGFAELLNRPDLTEDKRSTYTKIINQRTDILLNIINDLLDISKLEAGQLTLVEVQDDLNLLFNDLYQFFEVQKEYHEPSPVSLKFRNYLNKDQSFISADFFRLQQILINMIKNALKFTQSGYIEFGCKRINESTLLFYVEDTGMGIPKDKQEIIFKPFRQANETYLSREFGGTGLGLSIVKGLVKLMKGRIWVASELNKGTAFYFTLPYKPVSSLQRDGTEIQQMTRD
jgi:PAS domain S-box-containing protein